jgi:OmpA-OmpF porin, OOP family
MFPLLTATVGAAIWRVLLLIFFNGIFPNCRGSKETSRRKPVTIKSGLFIVFASATLCLVRPCTAQQTYSGDKDWIKQSTYVQNSIEADHILRIGDVDNLGFGWPDGFDPFCGRMTESHPYPWDARPEDMPGFDRILLSSRLNPNNPKGCGADGYSGAYNPKLTNPVAFSIPTAGIKGVKIENAWIQVFIDDFQAPSFCSRFQATLNGTRFAEFEKIINAIDQTGPVGKLISVPLPEEFYPAIQSGAPLLFKIDESIGVPDGFAIDFIRILVNRKRENACKGNIRGVVLDKETEVPIKGARIFLADKTSTTTDAQGQFSIRDVPAGFEVVGAAAKGYSDGAGTADVGPGDDNPEVMIRLEKGKEAAFNQKSLKVGETINLNNIFFDQGKADLKPVSKPELDKVVEFLQTNASAEIELSGHTSSEGEVAYNRSLSYQRVKACKDYLVSKGIDAGRIIAAGYGPDRPVAPNDTEPNRAKNRRVEMRLCKL